MTTRHQVTIPAKTTENKPYKVSFEILLPFVVSVRVRIPDGHKGMTHIKIYSGGRALNPAIGSTSSFLTGDGDTIDEEVNERIEGPPYMIHCVGWNEDDRIDHTFYVSIDASGGQ